MALRNHYPNLYQFIRNRERDVEHYFHVLSKSGMANLEIDRAGNRTALYSRYNPLEETARWLEMNADQIGQSRHILIFGFGLGYHIERVIEQYPDRTIHIIEPDVELFVAALEARDLTHIFASPCIGIFAIGGDESTNVHFIQAVKSYITDSFCSLFLPVYSRLYANEVSDFTKKFREVVLAERTNNATQIIFKREWPENIILNLPKTIESKHLRNLQGHFRDMPAIVVGSGPSLDQDIELVRQLQNHVPIFAAGSSIQGLLERGIKPHMIVSIDGSEKNFEVFRDLDVSQIPFVYASYIKHKIIQELNHNLYHVFISSDTITSHLFHNDTAPDQFVSTASVTGTVIQVAIFLGFSKLIFVGQDLSYPGNNRYSKGVDHFTKEELERFDQHATETVENVTGGTNPSSLPMVETLRNIESLIACYNEKIEFINVSQIGAAIKGTSWARLEDLMVQLQSYSLNAEAFQQSLQAKAAGYSSEEKRAMVDRLHKCMQELKATGKKIDKLMDIFEQLQGAATSGVNKIATLLQNIDKQWNAITRNPIFDPIYGFVLQAEIPIYARRVPEIVACTDLKRKAELVLKHLAPLVATMKKDTEFLSVLFEQVEPELTAIAT